MNLAIRLGSDAVGGLIAGGAIGSFVGPRWAAIGAVLGMFCGVRLALSRHLWRTITAVPKCDVFYSAAGQVETTEPVETWGMQIEKALYAERDEARRERDAEIEESARTQRSLIDARARIALLETQNTSLLEQNRALQATVSAQGREIASQKEKLREIDRVQHPEPPVCRKPAGVLQITPVSGEVDPVNGLEITRASNHLSTAPLGDDGGNEALRKAGLL